MLRVLLSKKYLSILANKLNSKINTTVNNKIMNARRKFIKKSLVVSSMASMGMISIPVNAKKLKLKTNKAFSFDWSKMRTLRSNIVKPTFPKRDFIITDFSAQPNKDNSQAFKEAIAACAAAGGGRVIVPKGIFPSAAIHLKSNVNLHLLAGAVIKFSTKPADYLPAVHTRFEGYECMSRSPLIYAYQQKNIAITGEGTLDGSADHSNWWKMWQATKNGYEDSVSKLAKMSDNNIPLAQRVFEQCSNLRPCFIEPHSCENILIEDITIKNAPFWLIHPLMSKNITVTGVTCDSHGPNNDGCDPESCENVLIEHCTFNTKDDGVSIKSGRNADGRRIARPSRNIIVANCQMNTKHTSVAIGSEMSGGVENVFIENLNCSNIQRVFRIKTNSMRGGFVRNIGLRNATVETATGSLIDIKTNYGKKTGIFFPTVENISVSNVSCINAKSAISLVGTVNIRLRNISLKYIKVDKSMSRSFYHMVENLSLENISIGK
ncbi:MAG: polygalacturonase [Psychromonas sp.]|jgi:polygalacturonase